MSLIVQRQPDPPRRGYIPAWTADALCAQTDPEAFFPPQGGLSTDGLRVCAACPVTAECLTHGLRESSADSEHNIIHGGKTPTELARMVARQRRKTT